MTPKRVSSNGYRIYGQTEVDRLQQILFFRELGVELSEIKRILSAKDFDGKSALVNHLSALRAKREQLNTLIANVEKSIGAMKGEIYMSDSEKFEGFKRKLVDENEKKYGGEIRVKYGNNAVNRSNAKIMGMTKERYVELERLTRELNETLKTAFDKGRGDPHGALAQKACALHKEWLCAYWDKYSKEAHIGVTQMYADDPRFTAYYDNIAPGCAVFLRDAVKIFTSASGNK